MTEHHNPYAPPTSKVADSVVTTDAYFTVGTLKLSLMALTTFGLYELYWFYRNWKMIRQREQLPISPFWRAFFAPLWTFSLGMRFKAHAKERNISIELPVAAIGILYLLLSALWRIPQPYWLISLFSFIPIVPFDRAARRLNGGDVDLKSELCEARPARHLTHFTVESRVRILSSKRRHHP